VPAPLGPLLAPGLVWGTLLKARRRLSRPGNPPKPSRTAAETPLTSPGRPRARAEASTPHPTTGRTSAASRPPAHCRRRSRTARGSREPCPVVGLPNAAAGKQLPPVGHPGALPGESPSGSSSWDQGDTQWFACGARQAPRIGAKRKRKPAFFRQRRKPLRAADRGGPNHRGGNDAISSRHCPDQAGLRAPGDAPRAAGPAHEGAPSWERHRWCARASSTRRSGAWCKDPHSNFLKTYSATFTLSGSGVQQLDKHQQLKTVGELIGTGI